MGLTVRCVLLVATGAMALATLGVSGSAADSTEDDVQPLLRELDGHIQRRFLDTTMGFGISRLVMGITLGGVDTLLFQPENDGERETIGKLRQLPINAVAYLGNGSLLESKPSQEEMLRGTDPLRHRLIGTGWRPGRALQGPVSILARTAKRPPSISALWDDARRAFIEVDRYGMLQFSRDGWDFVARPVRAVNETCVRCHNSSPETFYDSRKILNGDLGFMRLETIEEFEARIPKGDPPKYQVGDLLGVVLYATTRSE